MSHRYSWQNKNYPNFLQHPFAFVKATTLVFCNLCNVSLDQKEMAQHAHQKKHSAKLAKKERGAMEQTFMLETVDNFQARNNSVGRTLDPAVKLLRLKFVRACCAANLSLRSGSSMAELVEDCSKVKIGDVSYCGKELIPVIHELEVQKIRELNNTCFPQWSMIPDGTPAHCEVEGMCLRLVTYEWEFVQPLVRLQALKKSPDRKVLARAWENACSNVAKSF
jgi:hypothetical protein